MVRLRTVVTGALLVFGAQGSFAAGESAGTGRYSESSAGFEDHSEAFSMDVGGYGSFRYETGDADEVPSSFTLRRFVVTTDARLRNRLQVYSEVEYERLTALEVTRGVAGHNGGLGFEQEVEGQGELSLEQAWAQFNFSRNFGLRFGAVLVPVGRFNIRHDDNLWNFTHRPLIDRDAHVLPADAAWTEMGLGFAGERAVGQTGLVSYQAYLLNGVALSFAGTQKLETQAAGPNGLVLEAEVEPTRGAFDGSNRADAFAARVALSPALGSEVAVSGYVGAYTPDYFDRNHRVTTLGIDGKQVLGPITLEGEFLYTKYAGLEDALADFARIAVNQAAEFEGTGAPGLAPEVEIEVSGLSDKRLGAWVSAEAPLALRSGFMGLENPVLIPVARYERVRFDGDLDELVFSNGAITDLAQSDKAQDRLTLGLAFRPISQAVFHLSYTRDTARKGALIAPEAASKHANAVAFGLAVGF